MNYTEKIEKDPLLKALFDVLPLGIVIADKSRTIHALNHTMRNLIRKDEKDITGIRIGEGFNCVHAHDVPEGCGFSFACKDCVLQGTIKLVAEEHKTIRNKETSITIVRDNDSVTLQVLMSCIPFTASGEEFVLLTITDITDVKRMEKKRLSNFEKLSRIGAEAASIVHDIRNPITGILGYVDLLRQRSDITERDKRKYYQKMEDSAFEIKEMADEILSLTSDSVTTNPVVSGVNVEEFVKNILSELNVKAPVELRLRCQEAINIAESKFRQVAWNIIRNADEAVAAINNPKIIIESECDDEFFLFIVRDNGPGIPAELKDKLFMPGQTFRKQGGKGFGLFSAKRIISVHGGRIWYESDPDKGTVFYCMIPLKK